MQTYVHCTLKLMQYVRYFKAYTVSVFCLNGMSENVPKVVVSKTKTPESRDYRNISTHLHVDLKAAPPLVFINCSKVAC